MKQILIILIALIVAAFGQESGTVVITELHYNPLSSESSTETQYIEIVNTTASDINLNGWMLDDEDGDGPNTLPDVVLPAYGIAVICGSSAADFEGAFGSGYQLISLLDEGESMVNLGNSPSETSEIITLRDADSLLVDSLNYDDVAPWPTDPGGQSIYLSLPDSAVNAGANNDGANWLLSIDGIDGAETSVVFGVWDQAEVGSPGSINGDDALPVALASYHAVGGDEEVVLEWVTNSEVQNLGFVILRSERETGPYVEIASWQNEVGLVGQLNSNTERYYQYIDKWVSNDRSYWYKLVDVNILGHRHEHGPISAIPKARTTDLEPLDNTTPAVFSLLANYPNPFNPTTQIPFDIPAGRNDMTEVSLEVYDLPGRRIAVLHEGPLASGRYELSWNGQSDQGIEMPTGIYIAVLRSNFVQKAIMMALVR